MKGNKVVSDKQGPAGFLNRWSARKQQATEEQSADDGHAPNEFAKTSEDALSEQLTSELDNSHTELLPSDAGANNKTHQQSAIEQSQALESDHEPLLSDADMPPIESLSSDSDISGFFNKGVSAALKKAALRHVFMQPKYNVRDGLNDYDGDYTVFEPLGDTITSDMKWHTARKERNRLEAEARELEALEEQAKQQQTDDSVDAEENQPDAEPAEDQDQDDAQRLDEHQKPKNQERTDEPEEDTANEETESLLLAEVGEPLLPRNTLNAESAPSAAEPLNSAQRLPRDKESRPDNESPTEVEPASEVQPAQGGNTPDETTPHRLVGGKLRRTDKRQLPRDDPPGLGRKDRLNKLKEQEIPE